MRLLAALLPLLASAYIEEVRPVVLYITPLFNDDGSIFLYNRTLEFASVFMKNMVTGWNDWLHVFLVHRGKSQFYISNLTYSSAPPEQNTRRSSRAARDEYKCYEAADGYTVREISHSVLNDLANNMNCTFQDLLIRHVPDLASACDALAYRAMYDHLEKFKVNIYLYTFNQHFYRMTIQKESVERSNSFSLPCSHFHITTQNDWNTTNFMIFKTTQLYGTSC